MTHSEIDVGSDRPAVTAAPHTGCNNNLYVCHHPHTYSANLYTHRSPFKYSQFKVCIHPQLKIVPTITAIIPSLSNIYSYSVLLLFLIY